MTSVIGKSNGSVIISVLYIMIVMAAITLTTSSVIYNNYLIFRNDSRYQEAYYLAETGLNCVYNDLIETAYEVHNELAREYQWDPLKSSTESFQEGLRQHIHNYMGPRLRTRLIEKGILTAKYTNDSIFDRLKDIGTIKVSVELESRYNNPLKFTISSIGTVNNSNIKRRIDAEVHIYKVSLLYDSKLFDYSVVSGMPIYVLDSGYLNIAGNIYSRHGILASGRSSLFVNGEIHSPGPFELSGGSFAEIRGDSVFDSAAVGESSTFICINDLYSFSSVAVSGVNSSAYINGVLYITGQLAGYHERVGGVIAKDGGTVVLGSEFFINGCIGYKSMEAPLFGIDGLLNQGEVFLSGESIGGGNQSFYFLSETNSFINSVFNESYISKPADERAQILINYINTIPDDKDQAAYNEHISKFSYKGIIIDENCLNRSYGKGVILANENVTLKNNESIFRDKLPQGNVNSFFESVEISMLKKTSWDFKHHHDNRISVPLKNVTVVGDRIYPVYNEEPLIIIDPDDNDIILPTGSYKGIIVTGGAVIVENGDNVFFEGLIIAEGGIFVSGSLTVNGNRELLIYLLKSEDESLMNFFKIQKEPDFIQVISRKERNIR